MVTKLRRIWQRIGWGSSLDAPNQTIQEVVELENLVGSSHDIRPLGKRGCLGRVGCDTHAICIQKNERWLMRVAYQSAGVGLIWQKKKNCPSLEDVSHSGLGPNVAREWCLRLVNRGTCYAVDIGQMWQKWWPLSEDFVSLQTLTKCGPNCALCQRTLACSGLWPNVVQNVALVGELCLTADFNQMWSKMCPLLEDFVSLQTSTRCGLNMCPLLEDFVTLRTLTKCGPNMCPSMGDFVLLWSLTIYYGSTTCSSSKKAGTNQIGL